MNPEAFSLQLKQVAVGYDGKELLRDINFEIKPGQIVSLIGPNGAGKSTLLKTIARQLECVDGTIVLTGDELSTLSQNDLARRLSVLFTAPLRGDYLTGEEVVASGRYPYTDFFGRLGAKDREAMEEAMRLLRVEEYRDRLFRELSDGQKKRLMLARALCQDPRVLILDEPMSYLDIHYQMDFLSSLQTICRTRKIAVLMSVHELNLARRVSDLVITLRGDLVHRMGTPEEVLQAEYIRELFAFDTATKAGGGSIELPKPKGEARIMVIAGAGDNVGIYRRLQRRGQAFLTGIMQETDGDYAVAQALAQDVLAVKAFEPIPENMLAKGKQWIDACDEVYCNREAFGTYEDANRQLAEYAKAQGKFATGV